MEAEVEVEVESKDRIDEEVRGAENENREVRGMEFEEEEVVTVVRVGGREVKVRVAVLFVKVEIESLILDR